MWTLLLFGISILGIIGLICYKNLEQRRGSIPGAELRTTIDARVMVVATWLRSLPTSIQEALRTLFKQGVFHATGTMLKVLHFVERKLIRVINLVKGKGDITTKKGSASFFLQNVSTYKDGQPIE